jgi:predicted MPP superfamily phosphohydrolase
MNQNLLAGLIFFSVFTSIYTLLHWPIFSHTALALGLGRPSRWILRLLLALLILGPVFHSLTGRQVSPTALITYLWMALAFYLFLAGLILIPVRLLLSAKAFGLLWLMVVLAAGFVVGNGYFQAKQVKVRELTLTTNKLPPGMKELKLVQISDLHLHSVESHTRLERLIKVLEPLSFDLLISTGDLIEAGLDRADWHPLARRLAGLKPKLGKYAVFGNHEYYAGRFGDQGFAQKFHAEAGFIVLRQEAEKVAGLVQLVGLDDPAFGLGRNRARTVELNLLQRLDPELPVILLKHQPQVEETSLSLFDLQLSGHTHGGQLWPFNYLVETRFPRYRGLHELGGGSRLLVSIGTGTWGPPVRVGARPEVVLIRLKAG